MKVSDYTYIQYTTYNSQVQKSGWRQKRQMRIGALTLEWLAKHTKEHESRVQLGDSDWLFSRYMKCLIAENAWDW